MYESWDSPALNRIKIREFFHVSTAYVYAYDKQNKELIRSNEKLKRFNSNLGIVGETLN